MAQFARPASTITIDTWTDEVGGTTNIHTHIDEAVADNNDYIRSAQAPTTDPYVCKLSSVTDPLASGGHVVRYYYGKDVSGGAQIDIVVQLRQGYTNEGSPGTLIASATHTDVAAGFTLGSFTLSSGEADSITDYTDLYIRVTANQV